MGFQVVMITGAGSERGMGAGVAASFDAATTKLALLDIDEAGVRKVAAGLEAKGFEAIGLRCDITDAGDVRSAVQRIGEKFGKSVDVMVNAAGIVDATPIIDVNETRFRRMIDLNVVGAFNCASAVVRGMQEQNFGRLIFISSMASKAGGGSFGKAHYAASKAAVNGLCQGMARELGGWGITSNAIAPSIIDTGIIAKSVGDNEEADVLKKAALNIPVGRVGTVDDISHAVRFLADSKSGFITGEILDVNGGAYFS